MSDLSQVQTWVLRGDVDAQCATCSASGIEVIIQVVVRGKIEREPVTGDAVARFEMIDGDRPVTFQCKSCGRVTHYGEVMKGEVHDDPNHDLRREAEAFLAAYYEYCSGEPGCSEEFPTAELDRLRLAVGFQP